MRTNPIRQCAAGLTGGAFLQCDRGAALYVTGMPTTRQMRAEHFLTDARGALTLLSPERYWILPFCEWALSRSGETELMRLAALLYNEELSEAEYRLWLEGIKLLETGAEAGIYEKRVRQQMAICLRTRTGGGALYALTACVALINARRDEK